MSEHQSPDGRQVKAWAESLLECATPGPWTIEDRHDDYYVTTERVAGLLPIVMATVQTGANAALIAAAPDLAAALVDQVVEVERLRGDHKALLLLAEEMARELVIHCGDGHEEQVALLAKARASFLASHPSPEAT